MMEKEKRPQDPFADREAKRYSHPIPSRELILDFINQQKSLLSRKQLLQHLNIHSAFEKEAFRRRLRAMVRDGQLIKSRAGKYKVVKKTGTLCGLVIGHKDGFGFVKPDDGTSDIFISARQMRQVFDGDEVKVHVIDVDRENRREGTITEVIARHRKQIVGRFFVEGGVGFIESENRRINQDVIVTKENQQGAKSGQIVIAEIITPPTLHSEATGKIIEILGDYMAPGMETEVAIRSYDIPYQWSRAVSNEIKYLKDEIPKKEIKIRKDLRSLPLITIDGEDAKDFDDAVFCEKEKNGWRLLVAIADVSFYVKPKTALDEAAKERGNSVYFTGKVVPMLPAELSNGVCSLKPNVDRLCMVCEMSIDINGVVKKFDFYKAIMCSQARLTYTEVGNFLEDRAALDKKHKKVSPQLTSLHALYKVLHKQREMRGALDFETDEVKVEFGQGKKIKRLIPVVRNDAHRLIEECMLCANISAAKFSLKHKLSALYRVHDGPKRDKLVDLKEFLRAFGFRLGGSDLPTPQDYAALIEETANRPDAHLIQTLLLRSLSQAIYSADCDAHFGLAVEEYTHFTSPIRRYPDLIVHRAITSVLNHQKEDFEALEVLGQHCSMTERRASEATRDALSWLKCEYMLDKLGDSFEGVISGVTGFGMFVELKNIYVEGLIHISHLPNDQYRFDPVRHQLIGRHSDKRFCLGDQVFIQVARVNLENREIDFALI